MQSTLYTRPRLDLLVAPPLAEMADGGEQLAVSGAALREQAVISTSPSQWPLPDPVAHAVATLRHLLSSAPATLTSAVTQEIPLPSTTEQTTRDAFIDSLSRQLAALYFPECDSTSVQTHAQEWRASLSILFDHFQHVASLLKPTGYTRAFVAATRNSFADHFHVHDFYTYIVYCGRELGTEVIVGELHTNELALEERKDSWQRHTHRITGPVHHLASTYTSDTRMGLLVPPFVAHRACQAQSPQGKMQPNLALALTVFPALGTHT